MRIELMRVGDGGFWDAVGPVCASRACTPASSRSDSESRGSPGAFDARWWPALAPLATMSAQASRR